MKNDDNGVTNFVASIELQLCHSLVRSYRYSANEEHFPLGLSFRAQRGISSEFATRAQRHHEGETNAGFVLQAKRFLCCLIAPAKRIIVDNDLVDFRK